MLRYLFFMLQKVTSNIFLSIDKPKMFQILEFLFKKVWKKVWVNNESNIAVYLL